MLLRDLAYAAAAVVSAPIWATRMLRTGKHRTDWAGRFGHIAARPKSEIRNAISLSPAPSPSPSPPPALLIHAVSVGEVNAIRGLVAGLAAARPDVRVVICSTTDTGHARATQLFGERHEVVRYPLDFSFAVRRFLDGVRPDVVALTELELWPNFVSACRRRGIAVCVVNGRLSDRSFKRYRLARPLLRGTFASLDAAAVQTPVYAERFRQMGTPADRVRVLDSMKWDNASIADEVPGADELAAAMGIDRSRPLIAAGSTGPGEEAMLINTCPREAQLLVAPRRPERFDEVTRLVPGVVRRTAHADGTHREPAVEQRFFLLDTLGELRKAYALADVCVVGRSFLGLYGSDPTEPIALGKPTVIGPHHADFADMVTALADAGGLIVTDEPGATAATLLADRARADGLAERGRATIRQRQGATQRHVELLLSLLPEPTR
ncbi:MAG: glycosyltransferase N-terminal domain-containing protein [Phycisphaeraceae bacterium]